MWQRIVLALFFNEVAKNHKKYKQHNRLKLWNIRHTTLYNDNLAPDSTLISYPNFLLFLTNVYRNCEDNCSYLWLAIYLFYYHFFAFYTQVNWVNLKEGEHTSFDITVVISCQLYWSNLPPFDSNGTHKLYIYPYLWVYFTQFDWWKLTSSGQMITHTGGTKKGCS